MEKLCLIGFRRTGWRKFRWDSSQLIILSPSFLVSLKGQLNLTKQIVLRVVPSIISSLNSSIWAWFGRSVQTHSTVTYQDNSSVPPPVYILTKLNKWYLGKYEDCYPHIEGDREIRSRWYYPSELQKTVLEIHQKIHQNHFMLWKRYQLQVPPPCGCISLFWK